MCAQNIAQLVSSSMITDELVEDGVTVRCELL